MVSKIMLVAAVVSAVGNVEHGGEDGGREQRGGRAKPGMVVIEGKLSLGERGNIAHLQSEFQPPHARNRPSDPCRRGTGVRTLVVSSSDSAYVCLLSHLRCTHSLLVFPTNHCLSFPRDSLPTEA